MKAPQNNARPLMDNLIWFAGSLVLAFSIWVIATLESDPIIENTFLSIPVEVNHAESLLVTDLSRANVGVSVRGPRSTINRLSNDDIEVLADLSDATAGTFRVDLVPRVSRSVLADTLPRQITVTLEESREKFIEVREAITSPPPRGYEIVGEPAFEVTQALVSGALSRVDQVVAAQVELDLSQQRSPMQNEVRLIPVDVDGAPVPGVTLEPSVIEVRVEIQPRPDIREVRVVPNILYETLPEGYVIDSITLRPDTVVITGSPESLENAPGAFFTEPIDLTGRTSSFQQAASVQLPLGDLFVVENQNVTVSIGVAPLVTSRQFDRVTVEVIGVPEGWRVTLNPDEVTTLLTGPQAALDNLSADDLRVVVDVNGLTPGNYQLMPEVSTVQNGGAGVNISVLPAEIGVSVVEPTQAAETPTSTPTN